MAAVLIPLFPVPQKHYYKLSQGDGGLGGMEDFLDGEWSFKHGSKVVESFLF